VWRAAACILTTSTSLSKKSTGRYSRRARRPARQHIRRSGDCFQASSTEQFRCSSSRWSKIVSPLQPAERTRFRIPSGHKHPPDEPGLQIVFAPNGATLSGDQALGILDIVGIVVNRIPSLAISQPACLRIRMGSSWSPSAVSSKQKWSRWQISSQMC